MISLIEGLPDDVVGILATGKVTKKDCDRVLVPAVQETLSRHDKIRLYYELSSRFPGAAWDDLQVGIEPLPQWARIAVVTDVGRIRHTVNALRFLIPGDIRVFATVRAQEGRDWIAADPHNKVGAGELPDPFTTVQRSRAELRQPAKAFGPFTPAIAIKRSFGRDFVTCLDCGWRGMVLRRHLAAAHGLSPRDYRAKWDLRDTYPLTAPTYSKRRSSIAKQFGLGRGRKTAAVNPNQGAPPFNRPM